MPARATKQIAVAVTGASGSLGRAVLPRLLASDRVSRVVAFDLYEPEPGDRRLSFAKIDLTRPAAAAQMAAEMTRHGCSALVHLAFFSSQVHDLSYAHEVEVFGTTNVLTACHDAGLATLVAASSTAIYGASARNPNYLTEQQPPSPAASAGWVADKIEAEAQLSRFGAANPGIRTTVLRLAPVVGPHCDTPFTRFLGRRLVPAVLGHDPLVQCVHEDDVAEAVRRALFAGPGGPLNIVGRGVLPLSEAVRLAGATALPLPESVAAVALKALDTLGLSAMPAAALPYLRYLWVADGARAERELGFKPRYSTREAILSFAQAHRAGPAR